MPLSFGGDKLNINRVYEVLSELNKLSNKELCVIGKALLYLSENRFDADDEGWKTLDNGVHVERCTGFGGSFNNVRNPI